MARRKNLQLEWNVFKHDFNSDKIITYNVLNDSELIERIYKSYSKKELNKLQDLKDLLDRYFHYHYWCKSECEVLIGGLFSNPEFSNFEKIDIWTQLEMNFDHIVDYINREMQLELK